MSSYGTVATVASNASVIQEAVEAAEFARSEADNPEDFTLDDAISILTDMGGEHAEPNVLAEFIRQTDQFNSKQKAIVLAEDDHEEILEAFVSAFEMRGLSPVEAMRYFVLDSGLELPKDTNMANTILHASAEVYKTTNPQFGGDADDVARLWNAFLMLNDSLHSTGQFGRARMTEQQYMHVIDDEYANEIPGFSEEKMRQSYREISNWPLQVRDKPQPPPEPETQSTTDNNVSQQAPPQNAGAASTSQNTNANKDPSDDANQGGCCVIL